MTEPVLVLGAEPRTSLCIARSLYRHGIVVDVATFSPEASPLHSRAVRKFIRLPSDEEPESKRLEALVSLIESEAYDLLIPANDSSLWFVTAHHDRLRELLLLACPSPSVVLRVLDKDQTLEAAARCGIAVPSSYQVSDLNQLIAIRDQLRFPLVAKGRSKREIATSTFKVRYYQSFDKILEEFESDPNFGKHNLLQEYCVGDGVGLGLLIHKGEALAAFQHRRLKEFPSTGGVSVLAISEPLDAGLLKSSMSLLRSLEWEGVAMVEFRHDRSRDAAVLMEVNGRYWGTVSFAVHCGLDLPFYDWQIAHGETPVVPSEYRAKIRWRWTAGYLRRLHDVVMLPSPKSLNSKAKSRGREVIESFFDLLPPVRSALSSRFDPIPALLEVANTLAELTKSDVKQTLRALLPASLSHHFGVYRGLDRKVGSTYLKLQALRSLRLRGNGSRRMPNEIRSVLFVCHGNIIRSPMGEVLLRHSLLNLGLDGISVLSAGVSAKSGRGADARAIVAAKDFDVSLDLHRAQLLSSELLDWADVVFVMDYLNEARLLANYPQAARKVFMLGGYAGTQIEIPDPYSEDLAAIQECYLVLRSCIDVFVQRELR